LDPRYAEHFVKHVVRQRNGIGQWFGGEAKTHAIKDVSFEASFGEMLYVVGPSGSGKTTMLSIICWLPAHRSE
jgi:putative ABC transport system ATP-binding protein